MNDRINFFDHVKQNFAFLLDKYGFHITTQKEFGSSLCIEYCTDQVYVRVLKTAPDFEPYFVFGRIGIDGIDDSGSFDWIDVGALNCCRDWKWQRDEAQPFVGHVVQLARLLRECGDAALRAEDAVYTEMAVRRTEGIKQHSREERELVLRSRAQVAWDKRDYKSVVKLYGEIEKRLSDVEKKRMAYAAKQSLP